MASSASFMTPRYTAPDSLISVKEFFEGRLVGIDLINLVPVFPHLLLKIKTV
jgi:hypothetical protein